MRRQQFRKMVGTGAAAGFAKRLKFIDMCYRAGVRLIAGTDGPGFGPTLPGYGLHSEIELFEKAGTPPMDALRAATITAAEALHAGFRHDRAG